MIREIEIEISDEDLAWLAANGTTLEDYVRKIIDEEMLREKN